MLCKFFAQGTCKRGGFCHFIHEKASSAQSDFGTRDSASPDARTPLIDITTATRDDNRSEPLQVCRFFLQGLCYYGDRCKNQHAPNGVQTISEEINLAQKNTISSRVLSDSRSDVPCRFFSRPEGCQKSSCPYLHARSVDEQHSSQDVELDEGEVSYYVLTFTRNISGASIRFDEFGHVLDISFQTDYSCACITGLPSGITPTAVVEMLHGFGLDITANCVRVLEDSTTKATKATLKVKDPLVTKDLCDRVNNETSTLHASIMPLDARQIMWRKLLISWHKATRSVWLNFGNEEIADRVTKKFNNGSYMCLGHLVKSSAPTRNAPQRGFSRNLVPWTIVLSNVPAIANSADVEKAIFSPKDRPRHVEMGTVSYHASEPEVSVAIRSCLEKHGPLESFFLLPTPGGKRSKAVARFQNEEDARSAAELNNTALSILGRGKLTVAMVQSVKVKVPTAVYSVSQSRINEGIKIWNQQNLKFRAYADSVRPLTTLKVEGAIARDVASACRTLNEIMRGTILVDGGNVLWGPALGTNGKAYQKLLSIARDLDVVITREKSKQQLRFHGPDNKIRQTVSRIGDMLNVESSSSYNIDLNDHQFSWAIHGGFKELQRALTKDVAVFNVVARKIIVYGTTQQHDSALATINSGLRVHNTSNVIVQPDSKEDCPVCFCEAENPIQCSCKHTYCLECFEGLCESAASASEEEFRIQCCGSGGTCTTAFTLKELRSHLPSSVFESILQKSFKEYVKRHPNDFQSCPTPDCDHIFRCSQSRSLQTRKYTCVSCFEQFCTSCYVQHGEYTCAEYKDIASGGIKALEKLKRELNIKDCPRCKTPMEKTMGCNHMECGGCKVHICWVCMDVFERADACYKHMNKVHGGIGLGLERFMD
ncbi:hypothetical protein GQ44DRAFT_693493 [Phaeosphaeriaceae sp. PMI808]|nr:hypothetical protein GQ44DRAFT_693493 [Phaeosphaeriaceae sp. PMI808]